MKRICFAGAYGIDSQGDDAALIVLADEIRRSIGDYEGVVIARHAADDPYAAYGLRSVQNIEHDTKAESVGRWFRGFNPDDDRDELVGLRNEIAMSDLLVIGAGNLLNDSVIDLLRGPVPHYAILTLIGKMVGKPVMWFGMSVGPVRTSYGRDLVRLGAELASSVTIRDAQSVAELRSLGYEGELELLPDAVIALRAPDPPVARANPDWAAAHGAGGPVIAVSARGVPKTAGLDHERFVSEMAATCDELVRRYDARLLFIPQCFYTRGGPMEDDRNVARAIVAAMRRPEAAGVVTDRLTVHECAALYHAAACAICMRLHGNVFAALQGVPSIGIAYHAKVREFHRWLGDDELVVSAESFSVEAVVERVEAVLRERELRGMAIFERIGQGRKEVARYAEIARGLLR